MPQIGNMSKWISALDKVDKTLARRLKTQKLEDYERLKATGLPIFADFSCPYLEFTRQNQDLLDFLEKYQGFIIRAIPNKKGNRKHKIGVKTYEDCLSFLKQATQSPDYTILLTEHEPTCKSGIVFLDLITRIEVGNMSLSSLEHGKGKPFQGRFYHPSPSEFRTLGFNTQNKRHNKLEMQNLMLKALNEIARSQLEKGYLEFVVTKKGKIRFLDYKINPAYS